MKAVAVRSWDLVSVRLRGFLGTGESELVVAVDRPILILLGPNGSGKSTILEAVEWALFGSTAVGSDGEELKGTTLETHRVYIHRGAEVACVVLRFEADGHVLEWSRVRQRPRPKPADDALNCRLDDEAVEADAVALLGVTPRLFRRVVCPGQSAVRALVSNETKERNAALDRLFGIELLNALASGLGKSRRSLSKQGGEISDRLDRLMENARREIRERFDRRAAARLSALVAGIPRDQLSVDVAVGMACDLAHKLGQEVAAGHGDLAVLRQAAKDLVGAADDRWEGAGPGERETRLRQAQSIAEAQRGGWQEVVSKRLDEQLALAKLHARYGDEDALKGQMKDADRRRVESEAALNAANARAGVLVRAKEWLDAQDAGGSEELGCPVCERPLVRTELDGLVHEALVALEAADGVIAELREDHEGTSKRCKAIDDQLSELAAQQARVEKAVESERRAVTELVESLRAAGHKIPSEPDQVEGPVAALLSEALRVVDEDPAAKEQALPDGPLNDVLGRLAGEASVALKATADEIQQAGAVARELRQQALSLEAITDFLDASAELDRLDQVVTAGSLGEVRAAVESVDSRLETVSAVSEIAAAVSASEAQQRVDAIAPRLGAWFKRLSSHDAFAGATLRVESTRDAGGIRNVYQIRACSDDGWEAGPGPMLSGGYQTTLAVAALCALAEDEESRTGLGLLALDEPTQSLDLAMTKRMATALGAHIRVPKLVVTTTDEGFAQALVSGAGASRVRVLRLADWTAAGGTCVKETS